MRLQNKIIMTCVLFLKLIYYWGLNDLSKMNEIKSIKVAIYNQKYNVKKQLFS